MREKPVPTLLTSILAWGGDTPFRQGNYKSGLAFLLQRHATMSRPKLI